MKQFEFKMLSWLCLGLFSGALFLTSCIAEEIESENPNPPTGKEVNIRFTVRMPRQGEPGTYAISKEDENLVREIDILSFKPDQDKPSGYAFAYHAEAKGNISSSGENKREKSFDITLIKDESNNQTLVVLANVRSLITTLRAEGMASGTDKDELLARLVVKNEGSWNANNGKAETDADKDFTPFPMWGRAVKF